MEDLTITNEQIKKILTQPKPFFDCMRDIYLKGQRDKVKQLKEQK